MTEFTVELVKSKDDQHSLVLWQYPSGAKKFVICSHYDPAKPIGSQWHWGHYFQELTEALEYWNEEKF